MPTLMLLMFLCYGVLINSIVSSFWLDFHRKYCSFKRENACKFPGQSGPTYGLDSLALLCEGVLSIPIQLSNLAQHDCAYCLGMYENLCAK